MPPKRGAHLKWRGDLKKKGDGSSPLGWDLKDSSGFKNAVKGDGFP